MTIPQSVPPPRRSASGPLVLAVIAIVLGLAALILSLIALTSLT
jgi:hypothetical protein